MEKNILYGALGLLFGIVLTWIFATTAVSSQNAGMMRMMGINGMDMIQYDDHHDYDSSMDNMMLGMANQLRGKAGDEFDKAFLNEMIVHHQGAIEMANLAKINANHQEIKQMANEIVNAQTKEIEQMKNWLNGWYNK